MVRFEPQFNIGERVYHDTIDSPEAIVLDVQYSLATKSITYLVSVRFGETYLVDEELLTDQKKVY